MSGLRVRGWDKWQSYRADRGQPPWIKVHRRLLQKPKWLRLSDRERGHLVCIWMLAAGCDGIIPDDPLIVQKMGSMDEPPDLPKLVAARWLEPVDANPTSIRRQSDVKATSRRRQNDVTATPPPPEPASDGDDVKATSGRRQGDATDADADAEADTDTPQTPRVQPGWTERELLELANGVLGLGQLGPGDLRTNASILRRWLYGRPPRSHSDVYSAITGLAAMRDDGSLGWDSVAAGRPLSLRPLVKAKTVADQGDGTALRVLWDVAVERGRRSLDPEPASRARSSDERPVPVRDILEAM